MQNKIIALGLILLSPSASFAGCNIYPGYFLPTQNDKVTVTVETDTNCGFTYYLGGELVNTGVKLISPPKHGKAGLAKDSLGFIYIKKTGFQGKDSFVGQICGKSREGEGCSTLTYDITVK